MYNNSVIQLTLCRTGLCITLLLLGSTTVLIVAQSLILHRNTVFGSM